MKNNTIRKTDTGFTMLEVIIVMAIMAVAATIAIPNVMSWLPNYRLKAAARELYANMQKAKSEAIKRNCDIGISFSTVAFPAQGGSYTVFLDDGAGINAGNAVQDADETPLFTVTMPVDCTLDTANFNGTSTGYNSRGFPLGNRVGSAILRNDNSLWYKMSLSNSGYPKIQKSSDGINYE